MANRRLLTSTAQPVVTSDNNDFYTADSADPSTFPVIFYTNTAERNRVNKSTYLSNAKTINGTLRGECDLLNPTLDIYLTSVFSYNYAYIAKFSRYYFVTGVTSVRNDLWRVTLEYDALMTYKTKIGALSAFVERNENLWTPNAKDDIYEVTGKPVISECLPTATSRVGWYGNDEDDPSYDFSEHFIVVLQGMAQKVVSGSTTTYPAVFGLQTLVFDGGGFIDFADKARRDTSFFGSKTIYDCVLRCLRLPVIPQFYYEPIEPTPAIVSQFVLPGVFSSATPIQLSNAKMVGAIYQEHEWKITISPWISSQSEWYKRYKPFRRYELRFLPFGVLDISPEWVTSNTLTIKASVNCLDGTTHLFANGHYLSSANCSQNLPLTKETLDAGKLGAGAITGIIGAAGAAVATGGVAVPLLGAALTGATSFAANAVPDMGIRQGTYDYVDPYPTLYIYDVEQIDRAPALFGYPLYQTKTLNGLTGFTKVKRVHVEDLGNATQREKDDVERLLTEGVIL